MIPDQTDHLTTRPIDPPTVPSIDAATRRADHLVPGLLLGLLLLAGTLVAADVESPLRAVVVAAFVLVAPGWALLRLCRLDRGWLGAALVVALSSALATAVAMVQLYTGGWSPNGTLLTLMVITSAAAGAALGRGRAGAGAR